MTSNEVRQTFIDFFRLKSHEIVPSSSVVIKNDPTLLFVNAGMNQFKDVFLSDSLPKSQRVCNSQKCLRVSGKHNDLEEVGVDTYHHTFFEMLGNWSFGDYFKEEAIIWAWELLTSVYKLNESDLYITVFGGDKNEGLAEDKESELIWSKLVDKHHLLRGSKKDNFWEMGETGPCGPSSEIHIDLRSDAEKNLVAGSELINTGHPLVVEIWNIVFIQFNRLSTGELATLPHRHVDTGMGLERLCMAIQKKESDYDTDIFSALIHFIELETGFLYASQGAVAVAIRVIADHCRAVTFCVSDGQYPSNVGAGYVVRRILRRALRYGYTFLELKEPFVHKLIPILAVSFRNVFKELEEQAASIAEVVKQEEIAFLRTLATGISRFERYSAANERIDGHFAFELYDTYGFPVDLTALLAEEKKMSIDLETFSKDLDQQRARARKAGEVEASDWTLIVPGSSTEFTGYDELVTMAHLMRYRRVVQKGTTVYQLVFDKTPFFAEGGGQTGDTGWAQTEHESLTIIDTVRENDTVIHLADSEPNEPSSIFRLTVNAVRRKHVQAGHTATHLLQASLKVILGKHVQQRGSRIEEASLRFDFSQPGKISLHELEAVEDLVNEKIRANIARHEDRLVPLKEALASEATGLFGEKYKDWVRVITFGEGFSKELCGGTHVQATGEIGLFKIVSEASVATGIRRVEAVTGAKAVEWTRRQEQIIRKVKERLQTGADLVTAVDVLVSENVSLKKKQAQAETRLISQEKARLTSTLKKEDAVQLIVSEIEVGSPAMLKNLSFDLKKQFPNLVLVLGTVSDGTPFIAVAAGDVPLSKGFDASVFITELAPYIEGGGGGKPPYATAGGKKLSGLSAALTAAKTGFKITG